MCEQCGRTFVSSYLLKKHMTKHTNDDDISHGICSKLKRHSTKLSEDKKQIIKDARNAVKEGRMTMYGASIEFNVPYSTLRKWCRRTDIEVATPSVGRPCYLGMNLEKKLKEWLLEAARTGELLVMWLNMYTFLLPIFHFYGCISIVRFSHVMLRLPCNTTVTKNGSIQIQWWAWYG